MATTFESIERPTFLDASPKQLLINGEWRDARSGRTFTSIDPSTGEVLAHLAEGDAGDIDDAVQAARAAFEGPWSKFTPMQRQNVLLKLADLVEEHSGEARLLDIFDMGAPVGPNGISRSSGVADTLRYYAGWATKLHGETMQNSATNGTYFTYTLKQPVGVVGSIIPWNAPFAAAVWKLAPVLATGCTMVLKPAEEAALSPLRLGELVTQLDLPPGVVNIVTGFGETAGAALTAHRDVDKIAFTGSSFTGQEVVKAAAGNLKRVSLELGGKSPDIVFSDAPLDAAVAGAAMGVFGLSGQVCFAGSRIFVERPIYEEFVQRVSDFADALRVGPSLDPETQIGPVVSQTQLERVTDYLEVGRTGGARMTAGGAIDNEALKGGYFVKPTVFADVRDDMRIAREEIFGPVASILAFDDIDDVARRANLTDFGLGGGVWTRDVAKAHRLAQSIRTGVVWVNTYGNLDPAVPFGGAKMSGWGKELSGHSLDEYLNLKSVWIRTDI